MKELGNLNLNKVIVVLAAFGLTVFIINLLSILTKLLVLVFYSTGLTILLSIMVFLVTFITLYKRGVK